MHIENTKEADEHMESVSEGNSTRQRDTCPNAGEGSTLTVRGSTATKQKHAQRAKDVENGHSRMTHNSKKIQYVHGERAHPAWHHNAHDDNNGDHSEACCHPLLRA